MLFLCEKTANKLTNNDVKRGLSPIFFKYNVRNKRTSIMNGGDEMIHGLSEEEKFKVIRPMLGEHMLGD